MKKSIMKKLLMAAAIYGLAGSVLAATQDFLPVEGLWDVPSNWTLSALPTLDDDVKISNSGGSSPATCTIGAGVTGLANRVRIGYSGGGTLNIIGGGVLITDADDVRIGWQDVGTLNLTNGTINVATNLTATSPLGIPYGVNDFLIGPSSSSDGFFNMIDGTVNAFRNFEIAIGAPGTMTMDGGAVNVTRDLYLGRGDTALLTMNGGTITLGDDLEIGSSGTGTLILNAGTITLTDVYEGDSQLRVYAGSSLNIRDGGEVSTAGLSINTQGGLIDLWEDGELFISDTSSNQLTSAIDNARILGNRLTNNVNIVWGIVDPGTTNAVTNATITAIASIPNLAGLTTNEAAEVLAVFGYTLGAVTEGSGDGVSGQVISQNPAAGSLPIAPGSPIAIVIQESGQVPPVVGFDYIAASNAIVAAGYVVGTQTVVYVFDNPDPGQVTAQDPAANEELALGSLVNFTYNEPLAPESEVRGVSPADWMIPAVWSPAIVPFKDVQNYEVLIQAGIGNPVTLTNFVAMRRLHLGDESAGQVDVLDGGHLIAGLYSDYAAVGWDFDAVLNVYSNGIFESRGAIRVGWNGSSGTINVDGGSIVAASWISLGKSTVSTNAMGDPLPSYMNITNGGSVLCDRFRDELEGITYQEGTITVAGGTLATTGEESIWITNGLATGFIVIPEGYVADQAVIDGNYTLTSRLPTYDGWASSLGVGTENEDDDLDLRDNLYEYALNGDPKDDQSLGEDPVMVAAGGSFEYTHLVRNDDSTLVYSVETSTDLANPAGWADIGYTTAIGTNVTGGAYDVVTNSIPTSADDIFIRLKVTNP